MVRFSLPFSNIFFLVFLRGFSHCVGQGCGRSRVDLRVTSVGLRGFREGRELRYCQFFNFFSLSHVPPSTGSSPYRFISSIFINISASFYLFPPPPPTNLDTWGKVGVFGWGGDLITDSEPVWRRDCLPSPLPPLLTQRDCQRNYL